MKKFVIVLAAPMLASLAACGTAPDSTNVADASNSAGAALENSAAELEATTDTLVENDIANLSAASNASAPAEVNNADAALK